MAGWCQDHHRPFLVRLVNAQKRASFIVDHWNATVYVKASLGRAVKL